MGESLKSTHAELKRCVFVVDLFIYLFILLLQKTETPTRGLRCAQNTPGY